MDIPILFYDYISHQRLFEINMPAIPTNGSAILEEDNNYRVLSVGYMIDKERSNVINTICVITDEKTYLEVTYGISK